MRHCALFSLTLSLKPRAPSRARHSCIRLAASQRPHRGRCADSRSATSGCYLMRPPPRPGLSQGPLHNQDRSTSPAPSRAQRASRADRLTWLTPMAWLHWEDDRLPNTLKFFRSSRNPATADFRASSCLAPNGQRSNEQTVLISQEQTSGSKKNPVIFVQRRNMYQQ